MRIRGGNGLPGAMTLVLAASLGTLVALEIALSLLGPGRDPPSPDELSGPQLDDRTRMEVIDDLRSQGIAAHINVFPSTFLPTDGLPDPAQGGRLFPLADVSRRTIVYCNESGAWSVFDTDEHGFRNPVGLHSIDAEPPEFLVLGDSYAAGACVGDGDDVAGQLRRRGRSAASLGAGGNGPLLELATLREFGSRSVVWLEGRAQPERAAWFARAVAKGGSP